ncbi:MAG TPA: hypothetical protein VF540_10865 [Segetibacter sp.]|jgi:hypothetical protein
MESKASFWQLIGLQDWFLKSENTETAKVTPALTPDDVFEYIIDKFKESIGKLSFATRIVFYHEYIISFSTDDYRDFMNDKKGIFGLIVQESVKSFYDLLKSYRQQGKTVEPSSNKWVFRFVSHPEYTRGDMGFIGKLMPDSHQQEENVRVTFIPRQTGIAQTVDINSDILKGFTFYSEGYYEVPYEEDFEYEEDKVAEAIKTGVARFEAILPDKEFTGKKLEYMMKEEDIEISGQEEDEEGPGIFRIPSEWVNSPHLRVRYKKEEDKFYLTSFGEKTIVNEKDIPASDYDRPEWTELPLNSRIVLNGIVTLNIFKS